MQEVTLKRDLRNALKRIASLERRVAELERKPAGITKIGALRFD